MKEETINEATEVLNFFKNAFCADRASFVTGNALNALKVGAVVKLETDDRRGAFFVGQLFVNSGQSDRDCGHGEQ